MKRLTDHQIAHSTHPAPIGGVATALGLSQRETIPFGPDVVKVNVRDDGTPIRRGKLILVTAMTATPKGAGKTVTSIGLGQALGQMGLSHCICLREPSIGPALGMKGGATGGGRAQVLPKDEINLHFTGDLHAVTTAHNLLAALIDNHVHFGNAAEVDPGAITWPRVMDLCDRQLRHMEIGLGAEKDGFPHRTRFDITAASEVMAVLALAHNRDDLEARLSRMVVASDRAGRPLFARTFGAVGAMSALLRNALMPNLVQTLERTPALVHCGPFANIAHGCSSVVATRLALERTDYVVTEAGFGADLGAEKFVHIKCRQAGLQPSVAVLVANCPALRYHGGADALDVPDLKALQVGLANLRVHAENLLRLGMRVVVALNRFPEDTPAEVGAVRDACEALGVPCEESRAFTDGSAGVMDLARTVKELADQEYQPLRYLYEVQTPIAEKLERVASTMYRAGSLEWDEQARADASQIAAMGLGHLPLCVAKTPLSLSDRKALRGAPTGFPLRVRGLSVSNGAGFIVVRTGAIERMPGMPEDPAALHIHLDGQGNIRGLR